MDRRDAGMIERGQHARLAAQALVESAAGRRRVRDLERDLAIRALVARDVDRAHAAAADRAQHRVAARRRRQFRPDRDFAQVVDDAVVNLGIATATSSAWHLEAEQSRASVRNSSSVPTSARR